MRRRDLIILLAGAMGGWPSAVSAQQKAMPVIGILGAASPGPIAADIAAFRQGLSETGYIEGQNVTIEYRWAEGHSDRLPALAAELVGRKVDLIAALAGTPPAQAAKTIGIVDVARFAASAEGMPPLARITWTLRPMSSAASAGSWS